MPGRGGTQGTDMREFPANKFENISGQHVFLWKDILGQPAVALTPLKGVLLVFTILQCFMVLQGELHLCWGSAVEACELSNDFYMCCTLFPERSFL